MGSAASRGGMLMFENIDRAGDFRVLDPPGQAPGPPAAPAAPVIAPAPVQADILLNTDVHVSNEEGLEDAPEDEVDDEEHAPEDGVDDEEGVEDAPEDDDSLADLEVHAHVQDVRVGPETLVVNTTQVSITTSHSADAEVQAEQETLVMNATQATITPDQQETSELEVHSMPEQQMVNILQQIKTTGVDTKFTPTVGPFLASAQPANTITREKLVEPVLEAVRVLEEPDGESVEGPALKRQAVEKDPGADLTNQAGPSTSECSENV